MIKINEEGFSQEEETMLSDRFSGIFSHINTIIAIAQNCPQYKELQLSFEKSQRYLKSRR